jgi:hypothetical protein
MGEAAVTRRQCSVRLCRSRMTASRSASWRGQPGFFFLIHDHAFEAVLHHRMPECGPVLEARTEVAAIAERQRFEELAALPVRQGQCRRAVELEHVEQDEREGTDASRFSMRAQTR